MILKDNQATKYNNHYCIMLGGYLSTCRNKKCGFWEDCVKEYNADGYYLVPSKRKDAIDGLIWRNLIKHPIKKKT